MTTIYSTQQKNRIGAWTTPTALGRLTESLLAKGDVVEIINVIDMVNSKGCKPSLETTDKVFEVCSRGNDTSSYEKLEKIARRAYDSEAVDSLVSKYPRPIPIAEAAPEVAQEGSAAPINA